MLNPLGRVFRTPMGRGQTLVRYRIWCFYNAFVAAAAAVWRRLMFRTAVIAVTGSVGKTTTVKCLRACLASKYEVVATEFGSARQAVPRALLRIRPRHRFAVCEVGILKPNRMWRSALVLRPNIAVVTQVLPRHLGGIGSIETIAQEKAQILSRLTHREVAVLNGDDARVAAMANSGPFKTAFFGGPNVSQTYATEVTSAWPGRLCLSLHSPAGTYTLKTNLVGTHWTTSLLAAIATAEQCGVSVSESVKALQGIEPFRARLEPVTVPQGAVVLRDEGNGSTAAYLKALQVLKDAQAGRRIIICGQVTDRTEANSLERVGEEIARSTELAIFVGPHRHEASQAALTGGMPPDRIRCFETVREAAEFMKKEVCADDLILLRGQSQDHVSRVYFALRGQVKCWISDCRLSGLCDRCWRLGFEPAAPEQHPTLLGKNKPIAASSVAEG